MERTLESTSRCVPSSSFPCRPHSGILTISSSVRQGEGNGTLSTIPESILDPLAAKSYAIKLATDAAVSVLRVDSIIVAKQAGISAVSSPVLPPSLPSFLLRNPQPMLTRSANADPFDLSFRALSSRNKTPTGTRISSP